MNAATLQATNVWNVGDCLVVVYDGEWFIGKVSRLLEYGAEVECMKQNMNKNQFRWPSNPKDKDVHVYCNDDILFEIKAPEPKRGSIWHGDFCMNDGNFNKANNYLKPRKNKY